jgi:hypothetical protein
VLAHERVLEAIMERGPVLPLRFGTELESEDELAAVLAERRDELARGLERVRGRVELGLRVLPAPPAILVGSYLVAEDQIETFRARADELAARHRELQLVVTGPWPPYSFATEEDR